MATTVHIPLSLEPGAKPPTYATKGAAGADLFCYEDWPITIYPGERRLFSTGVSIAVPDGYEAQVRPRSGLAINHGITVLNAPGTIDSDYRGEIRVMLINLNDAPFTVEPGQRIAQLVIAPIVWATWMLSDKIDVSDTERGTGGFGSTGSF